MEELKIKEEEIENRSKEIEISPELYSKVISIYNEFVRKYELKDKDVNLRVYCKEGELSKDIYDNIIRDAIAIRKVVTKSEIENIYEEKLRKLHDLKMSTYNKNLQDNELTVPKEKLMEMLKLEKDLSKLKKANNINIDLEETFALEERNKEVMVNKELKNLPETMEDKNEKLDEIEENMLDLNKKSKQNLISKEDYYANYNKLEDEKANLIWGVTLLEPSLLKEKYIDDQIIEKTEPQIKESVVDLGIEEVEKEQINNGIEQKEVAQPIEREEEQGYEEIITTTTTTTTTTTIIENEFIVELQSKVLINQNPENIIEIVKCQERRDLKKEQAMERDLER